MNKFSNVFKAKSFVFKDKLKDYISTSLSPTATATTTTTNNSNNINTNQQSKKQPAK